MRVEVRIVFLSKLDYIVFFQFKEVMVQVKEVVDKYEFYRVVSVINCWVGLDLFVFYFEVFKDCFYCGDSGGVFEFIFYGMLWMLVFIMFFLV